MTGNNHGAWLEENQKYFTTALSVLAEEIGQRLGKSRSGDGSIPSEDARAWLSVIRERMTSPPALEILTSTFSRFERDLLLLCAGAEILPEIRSIIAETGGQDHSPTFGLALRILPGGTWSALSPAGPLRFWRLIEIGHGASLLDSPLHIDERILCFLLGIQYTDERLVGILKTVDLFSLPEPVPSHLAICREICKAWSGGQEQYNNHPVQLIGYESPAREEAFLHACLIQGYYPFRIDAAAIPSSTQEQEALARLSSREMMLTGGAILLSCDDADSADIHRETASRHVAESLRCPFLVSRKFPLPLHRQSIILEIQQPTLQEQRDVWRDQIGCLCRNYDAVIDSLVSQFTMNSGEIRKVCTEILVHDGDIPPGLHLGILRNTLWDACRRTKRSGLQGLAERITPKAKWDQLVLPEKQMGILKEIAVQVRQRARVYDRWGFAGRSTRGLGVSALFTGMSGTGKTMAAEVLADDLRLDLHRIDLSQVVSKYIGETEKNLRKVFDAAEGGGAILLFDEADALFGRRSEVKDSHDRYANIEISYLLQRMEAYQGLAILTSNMKEAIDPAFMRRIRFIVQFPFPDPGQRQKIWENIFPDATPVQGLEYAKLARLNITGGTIRNIALHAAFLAADAGKSVQMAHILQAAKTELGKSEREVSESEVAGWV